MKPSKATLWYIASAPTEPLTQNASAGGFCVKSMGVIVVVRPLTVLLLLLLTGVIVAVGELVVVVGMGMPVGLVMPLACDAAAMFMGDVVVIVAVCRCLMRVVRLAAFALGALGCRHLLVSPVPMDASRLRLRMLERFGCMRRASNCGRRVVTAQPLPRPVPA